MNYISNTIEPYLDILPYFFTAVVVAFLLTPIVGFFMRKFGVFDLSATKAKSVDKNILKKINKSVALRGGGIAVGITFIMLTLIGVNLDKQIIAIIISSIILLIGGYIDDKYRTNQITQLIPQVLAALIVIAAGMSIDYIQSPFDTSISLRSLVFPFTLGGTTYSFAFPADIITLIWIMIIIHGVNWVFGVNGLGESITIITYTSILFISIKLGNPVPAILASIMAGGILGFFPFTVYPAKIMSGSTGTNLYGFLIAVLSILGGIKVSVAIIVLIIPLIDMIWVMVGRINRHGVSNISETLKVVTKSDHTHLHHRLLKLGFTVKQVILIEFIAVGICAIIAFATADLPKVTTISIIGVLVLIGFFIISILLRKGVRVSKTSEEIAKRDGEEGTPEDRYAY